MTQEKIDEVFKSVVLNKGSVQHLEFLSEDHKSVFKTAMEIDQEWIIEHAAVRQEFIDQGQSVNLFVPPTISKADLHKLHKDAWKKGLKSLYYCRSSSVGTTEKISNETTQQSNQEVIDFKNSSESGCKSCEG